MRRGFREKTWKMSSSGVRCLRGRKGTTSPGCLHCSPECRTRCQRRRSTGSCSSGLQTIAMASERIMVGNATTIVAGGTEHMSSTIEMPNFSPNPRLMEINPAAYMGMGLTAEQVAREFDVGRQDQDEFALRSHTLAKDAVEGGVFDEEIVPLDVEFDWVDEAGELQHMETSFGRDEGPRDTSAEKLANLKPAFQQDGTVTAGNSSQRSDGAAAVVVMDRRRPRSAGSRRSSVSSVSPWGVGPEVMGIGPTVAIPKVLEQTGLTMDDIDLIEFNEAFAAQALAVIREVGMDLEKTNVNGGAIALGHPMGATGTKLTVQLIHEMKRRGSSMALSPCASAAVWAPQVSSRTCRIELDGLSAKSRHDERTGWNHQLWLSLPYKSSKVRRPR